MDPTSRFVESRERERGRGGGGGGREREACSNFTPYSKLHSNIIIFIELSIFSLHIPHTAGFA